MSNREFAISLLNNVPEYKIGYVLAYLQGLVADEDMDDAYCASLYDGYLKRSEQEPPEFISLEEAAKNAGVQL